MSAPAPAIVVIRQHADGSTSFQTPSEMRPVACPGCAQRDTVIDHLWHELRLARRVSRVTRCTPPGIHVWPHGARGPCDCGERK